MLLVAPDVTARNGPHGISTLLTLCRRRSLGHIEREESKCITLRLGFHRPPDRMTAGTARGERALTTKRALMALEGGEHDAALARLVTVVEQVAGHASNLPTELPDDIGATP